MWLNNELQILDEKSIEYGTARNQQHLDERCMIKINPLDPIHCVLASRQRG